MIVLFEHPLSPYAQKCKIALREKGVPFEARLPIGIGSGVAADPGFVEASPRGEVPALIDGDVQIFDSTIILEYIEERWPSPPLLPDPPKERARVRILEDVMDTHYEPINWGLGEIHFFGRARGELAREITARAGQQVETWHRWLERQLGPKPWFGGDHFGWGDLVVVPYLNGSRGFGLAPKPESRLYTWLERVNQRPSVAITAQEAAAVIAGTQDVSKLVERGLFKREYRDHRLEWMIRSGGLEIVLDGLARDNIRFSREFD